MSETKPPDTLSILWFDPGGITGWAHLCLDVRAFSRPSNKALKFLRYWECGEFEGDEHTICRSAIDLVWNTKFGGGRTSPVVVGSEQFDLVQTLGGNELLSPVRINAVIDYGVAAYGVRMEYQQRGERLQQTAQRLEAFGFEGWPNGRWTTTGRGKDAFAAMQHAVTKLRRMKAYSKKAPMRLSRGENPNGRWDCACDSGRPCDIRHPFTR